MHFLESLTFISKIQDVIVKEFGATLRMLFREFGKPTGKFVTSFRHRLPPGGNLIQIVFFANAQSDGPINAQQLLLQVTSFGIKRRTEIGRDFAQPSICFVESRP